MKYRIIELVKTCNCYPSQWEGKLEDGRMVYIRYRWGCLDISISKDITIDIDDAVRGELICEKRIGENYDGIMENDELLSILKDIDFECKIKISS